MNSSMLAAAKGVFVSSFLILLAVSVVQGQTPSTTQVFSNIDDSNSGWGSCTECAGGKHNADAYWMAQFQTTPSKDGNSTQFYVSASQAYSDVLFWNKVGPQDWATQFTWDFWVYLDSASQSAENLEYDLFQYVNGREYMFGTQCSYAGGYWDVWNQGSHKWIPTSLACKKFTPNVWHHIVWTLHRTSDTMMHFDSLTLDSVQHAMNYSEPSGPLPSGWTHNLGVQWQLDTASGPLTFNEWVDEVKITIQ